MSRKFALIIGSDTYEDNSIPRLHKVKADMKGLADLLADSSIGNFDVTTYEPLYNENSSNVLTAIEDFFSQKKRDDLLLLFFAGHGIMDDYHQLYLAMANTKRNRLNSTSIPALTVSNLMDNSMSKRQIVVLDCCFGGAFVSRARSGVGSEIPFGDIFKEERVGYARVVVSSTSATQHAFEDHITTEGVKYDLDNSAFTHYLIQGLKTGEADLNNDGYISIDELFDYAHDRLVDHNDRQTPKIWVFARSGGPLVIAKSIKIAQIEPLDSDRLILKPLEEKIARTLEINHVSGVIDENVLNEKTDTFLDVAVKEDKHEIKEDLLLSALVFARDHLKTTPAKRSDFWSIVRAVKPVFNDDERIAESFVEQAIFRGWLEETSFQRVFGLTEKARAVLNRRR